MDLPREPGTTRQSSQQLVDSTGSHRFTKRFVEEVDQHEVALASWPTLIALEPVGVIRQHQQVIHGNGPAPAGLRPCSVGIVPPPNVQVRVPDRTAQAGGISKEMNILTSKPRQLPSAQSRPGHGHHDETVTRRTARPQQPEHFSVAGTVNHRFGLGKTMTWPSDITQRRLLPAHVDREMPVISDVIKHSQHMRRHLTKNDTVAQEPSDHG